MLQSMTGFATKTISIPRADGAQIDITFNIKSLNSRYFETLCKLPTPLQSLETTIISLMKKGLRRGKIYFTVHLSNPSAFEAPAEPALNVVKGYLDAIELIKKTYNLAGEVNIADIIQLPHVFGVSETSLDERTKQMVSDTIGQLINDLTKERIKEGNNLKADLVARTQLMQKIIAEIEREAAQSLEKRKQTLLKQLEQVGFTDEQLEETKRAIVYTELDKMDIHEEIVRFKSHVQNMLSIINSPEPEKGKRLDFTLQELFRETNTIAAKCSDAGIGNKAIAVKVELEKAREQVQNVV